MHTGSRIKELRTSFKLSQRELAKKAKITPSMLCKIENGSTDPRDSTLQKIFKVLDRIGRKEKEV